MREREREREGPKVSLFLWLMECVPQGPRHVCLSLTREGEEVCVKEREGERERIAANKFH